MLHAKSHIEIFVASREQLISPSFQARLRMAVKSETLSRRKLLDDLAETIYSFKGCVLLRRNNGVYRYPIPDIYSVMGGYEGRWLSLYMQDVNGKPRHQTHQLERLRLLDLRYRIISPQIAQHFVR